MPGPESAARGYSFRSPKAQGQILRVPNDSVQTLIRNAPLEYLPKVDLERARRERKSADHEENRAQNANHLKKERRRQDHVRRKKVVSHSVAG